METKHTKGEWVVEKSGAMPKQRIRSDKMQIICDCFSFSEGIKDEEAEANAKLIAAAPELLEALIKLLSSEYPNYKTIDDSKHPANLALIAIKKATE